MSSNVKIVITPHQTLKLERLKNKPFVNARLYVRKSHIAGEGGYELVTTMGNPLYGPPTMLEGDGKLIFKKRSVKHFQRFQKLVKEIAPIVSIMNPELAVGITAASMLGGQLTSGHKKPKYTLAKKKSLNTSKKLSNY